MAEFQTIPRTAPTINTGFRDPLNTNATRIVPDVQDEILFYLPNAAPLTVMTARFRDKRQAHFSQYYWLEKDLYPRVVVLSADSAIGDLVLDVQAGQGGRIAANYTLLNIRTRELVRVTSVTTDALTVTRGLGGGELDMVAGDTLVFIAPAYEDGVGIGTIKSVQEAAQYNYTQIIRTPMGLSGRQLNTELYGGRDEMTEEKWQGVEHARSIEKMMLFGKRSTAVGPNNRGVTTSGGAEFFISSNVWDVSGVKITERGFVEFLEEAMRWGRGGYMKGSSTKYAFLSARWMTEIQFFARDRLVTTVLDKQIGLEATKFVTTFGTLMLMHSPVLDEDHPGTGFILDLNHTRYVCHKGRDTKFLRDRQAPDLDAVEHEHFSDVGFELELEGSCAMLKGLPA